MSYKHLIIDGRYCIYQFKIFGMSIRQIARALHRPPSTISRELKRNSYKTSIIHSLSRYLPNNVQKMADKRCKNFCRKISYDKASIEYIQNKLTEN